MQNRLLTLSLIFLLGGGILFAQTKGRASYYSDKLHDNFMSNWERYNKDSMTCAHLKYPLGTLLKVRNLSNGREVIVKVTDRGPHTRRFVIDLSKAAAKKLDIIRSGHSLVESLPITNVEYLIAGQMMIRTTRKWTSASFRLPVSLLHSGRPTRLSLQRKNNRTKSNTCKRK